MNVIHFLYNKLIDNGILKFTALGCHPFLPHLPELRRTSEYTRALNMPLLAVI